MGATPLTTNSNSVAELPVRGEKFTLEKWSRLELDGRRVYAVGPFELCSEHHAAELPAYTLTRDSGQLPAEDSRDLGLGLEEGLGIKHVPERPFGR